MKIGAAILGQILGAAILAAAVAGCGAKQQNLLDQLITNSPLISAEVGSQLSGALNGAERQQACSNFTAFTNALCKPIPTPIPTPTATPSPGVRASYIPPQYAHKAGAH